MSKVELAQMDRFWRKTMTFMLKAKHPSITQDEIIKILDDLVPLTIKSLYKSDQRAAKKILAMSYREDKIGRLATFLIMAIKGV